MVLSAVQYSSSSAALGGIRGALHALQSQALPAGGATPAVALCRMLLDMRLDLGCTDKGGRYNHGLHFQLMLTSSMQEGSEGGRPRTKGGGKKSAGAGSVVSERGGLSRLGLMTPPSVGRDCIGKGGRFDDMVLRFRTLQADKATPLPLAVGFRLALDKITALVSRGSLSLRLSNNAVLPSAITPSADVLVAATGTAGAACTAARLAVASQLWAAHITAEFMHPTPLSFDDLQQWATAAGSAVLVLVKPRADGFALRVRSLDGRTDIHDVAPTDVARVVAKAIVSAMPPPRSAQAGILASAWLSRRCLGVSGVYTSQHAAALEAGQMADAVTCAAANVPMADTVAGARGDGPILTALGQGAGGAAASSAGAAASGAAAAATGGGPRKGASGAAADKLEFHVLRSDSISSKERHVFQKRALTQVPSFVAASPSLVPVFIVQLPCSLLREVGACVAAHVGNGAAAGKAAAACTIPGALPHRRSMKLAASAAAEERGKREGGAGEYLLLYSTHDSKYEVVML